ncbi:MULTISPECIES: KTSC domain-containing protein [Cellulophaga]|uniref:Heat shock protein DnaJ domain protein n=1 Tax=Cellulophaga lytica (strain ATCC 23178 / DSM 7489 / JCM 8516 / NBRC 14961 / NCIMB 1423 / VKM B-1433 / Cy l20) TaxID=867900 RepID=F0RBK6_CELLC|nr:MULTISPECIES: KTSC domain-containing protein [Cellulophaga]ADY30656.1 heat shock protein DnaJ domain protein [Cellulophaga lytica DSM 7489]AIM61640.1 molecular chaperone DnaJ [Cellulophaga lytica]APU11535.1 molecular chaperone DnaJ [Cellulophaga lytica]MDO6853095.1 KTSC domain-containing protein [Cellulophaga lytica]TVZ10031.1 DnaJ-like protein [Cellulophaga sp. RHA_52]
MKRINQYKKMFSVENSIDLKSLKTSYRKLVKEWHPDKFQEGDAKREEAEIKSREIIDGYHFLVSIAPETKLANAEEYKALTTASGILDFQHKGQLLEITFLDGTTYEYFGVPKKIYIKMINSDKIYRFAKRNIFESYMYRKSKKTMQEA